ncbi:DUF1592 domain-containing protein, partial [bacterium]|nr:DUF1592 domain-containing protein [bacterium]
MKHRSDPKLLIGVLLVLMGVVEASRADNFNDVRPLLARYCFACHGEEKQKGDVRIDHLDPDLINGKGAEIWHDVLDQLNLGEMPPKKAKQPNAAERQVIVGWTRQVLKEAATAKRLAGGRVKMRRLTRYEYRNTMRDLLEVERDFSKELPPEPMSPEGFLNNASSLEMSPTQIETYLSAARRAMEMAIVEGEHPKIHRYQRSKTAIGQLPTKKVAGHLPVNPEFAIDVETYPRQGPFHLRLTARAMIPEGVGFPRIRISLGHVPGIVHVPHKIIGEVELTSDQPQSFEFSGWMEDYPQAGDVAFGNSGIKGMILMLDYLDADGNELRYPDRQYVQQPAKPKKGVKPKPKKEPPPFGSRFEIDVMSLEFETPYYASWPPVSHQLLLGDGLEGLTELQHARRSLGRFLSRAFRRPATPGELSIYSGMFEKLRKVSSTFEEAMRETCAAVLISPNFLYQVESRDENAMKTGSEAARLTGSELASRLSYFLWSTMPDQRLIDLAAKGKLSKPGVLKREVERMLKSSRADQLAENFASQWFDLGALDRVAVNPEFYPDFDNALKEDMRGETIEFFQQLLRNDVNCLDVLDGDWTMLNRALARHYGIDPLPRSSEFARTLIPENSHRGGILGHAAILLAQSSGEFAHPIKRAVWILDRLLDSPPAPPPPDVPNLDAESADLAGLTVREQLALHREKESCANCHRGIDPWGLSLERFDAVGSWGETAPVRLVAKGEKKAPRVVVDARTE